MSAAATPSSCAVQKRLSKGGEQNVSSRQPAQDGQHHESVDNLRASHGDILLLLSRRLVLPLQGGLHVVFAFERRSDLERRSCAEV